METGPVKGARRGIGAAWCRHPRPVERPGQLFFAEPDRRLTAHGTLYKALGRLEAGGLLESRWEDPDTAVEEGRPRRRLYRVTGAGELAIQSARALEDVARRMQPGLQPS